MSGEFCSYAILRGSLALCTRGERIGALVDGRGGTGIGIGGGVGVC